MGFGWSEKAVVDYSEGKVLRPTTTTPFSPYVPSIKRRLVCFNAFRMPMDVLP
jgi:hypothetical protein